MVLKNLSKEDCLILKNRQVVDPFNTLFANKNMCLPLCIVLGMKFHSYKSTGARKVHHLRGWVNTQNKAAKLLKAAENLCKQAQISCEDGCSMDDVYTFFGCRSIKSKFSIYVYSNFAAPRKRLAPYKIPGNKTKPIHIFLLDDLHHFVFITDIKKFFGTNSYCARCNLPHNANITHRCENMCTKCYDNEECEIEEYVVCKTCNRRFNSNGCYLNHKIQEMAVISKGNLAPEKTTVCDLLQICKMCNMFIDYRKRLSSRTFYKWTERSSIEHECGEYFCQICGQLVNYLHQCYIQKYIKKTPLEYIFVFFDIECMQVDLEGGSQLDDNMISLTHIPNLLIADRICNVCVQENDVNFVCSYCTQRRHVFENDTDTNCVDKFISYLFNYQKFMKKYEKNVRVYIVSHNFKSYDSYFVVNSIMRSKKYPESDISPILRGMQVLKLTVAHRYVFLDSLNFLPMRLANFPKAFALENVVKGYYPHLYNTQRNYKRLSPNIPDKKYFMLDNMSVKDKENFDEWYEGQRKLNQPYCNRTELIKYCGDDVRILREGVVKFMSEFYAMTSVNPLTQAFTLAGAVFIVYARNFMIPKSLAIIKHGFSESIASFKGTQWLINVEKELVNQPYASTSNNNQPRFQKEYKIRENIIVDGFDTVTKTVYEFYGCIWHSCPKCLPVFHLTPPTKTKVTIYTTNMNSVWRELKK